LDAFERERDYGFLASNSVTGFSPADGTFVIHEPEWDNATITIRGGVRVNANFTPTSANGAILAVGDSFVFGDQVSDSETWPAVLEKQLNRRVINGGVSNYGAAQAVLRAEQLLKADPYTLVILSILVGAEADLWRDRLVNGFVFYRPAVIRERGEVRQTTIEESRKIVLDHFICDHPWIPEFFFWSYVAKRFFSRLGYDGQCWAIVHPKAATVNEILEFVVERLARFPVNKAILIQYPSYSFKNTSEPTNIYDAAIRASIDEARMIREVANRYGVPVVDTYDVLKNEPLDKIYRSPHHSKKGNELVADLIAREIPVLMNSQSKN
jgi:lysophospholipase L1-like esterase